MQLQELHMLVVLAEELNMRKAAERLLYLSRLYLSAYKPLKRRGEQKSFKIPKRINGNARR